LYCSADCALRYNREKHIELRKRSGTYKKWMRHRYYKTTYKISDDEKDDILKRQEGVCAICESIVDNPKNWHLDHCHVTGKIRGVLCHKCNQGLGLFKDDIIILEKAIKYLNENRIP